ncbi:MAG TPA: GNAT family N-acetyltransferase [Candidatus Solibacter sp.]|jgi:ribosomal protein S18 acetylase RimI-like enzyme|nr:GNAT family N-acetyltransferase [Candidatus Solibacter sp.]
MLDDVSTSAQSAVRIRPARLEDAGALADIYMASAEHHQRLDPSLYRQPDWELLEERYRSRLPSGEDSVILAAVVEGDVVGLVDVQLKHPDGEPRMLRDAVSAEIDIAVLPESRGSGVGTELMAAAEAWAFEHGAEFMTLQVHTANVDAIRFYQERHGWRTSGLFMLKRPESPG